MVPFESLGTVSYLLSIVTMAVSLAISEMFSVKDGLTLWHHWIAYEFLLASHSNYGTIV